MSNKWFLKDTLWIFNTDMFRKPGKILPPLLLVFLFTGISFRFEVKQLRAWADMIIDYTSDSGFSTAFEETFSGEKPCEMCVSLTLEKTTDRDRSPAEKVVDNIREIHWLTLPALFQFPCPETGQLLYPSGLVSTLSTLREPPPRPPPIRVS